MSESYILDRLNFLNNYIYVLTLGVLFIGFFCFVIYRMVRNQGKAFEEKKKNDLNNSQVVVRQLKSVEDNLTKQIAELRNNVDKTVLHLEHTHELEKQRISNKVEELSTTFEKFIELLNKLIGEDIQSKKK